MKIRLNSYNMLIDIVEKPAAYMEIEELVVN